MAAMPSLVTTLIACWILAGTTSLTVTNTSRRIMPLRGGSSKPGITSEGGQVKEKRYTIISPQKVNFWIAQADCNKRDMRLMTIESKKEQLEMTTMINKRFVKESFWTSGSNLANNKTYVWMSSGRPLDYTCWHSGKPSRNEDGQCLALTHTDDWDWTNEKCLSLNLYACESFDILNT